MQLLKEEIEKEMQKNNVFILGAGFSLGAGIPEMPPSDGHLKW